MGNIVEFKSNAANYWKEKYDLKNNTLRENDAFDPRFRLLRDFKIGLVDCLIIRIRLGNAKHEFFERVVRDVTFYKGWYVVTWNPIY